MRFPFGPSIILVATSLTAVTTSSIWFMARTDGRDPCGLPTGMTSSEPSIVRRAMACRDLERGRISRADYRVVLGLDTPPMLAVDVTTPQWASSVRAVSSEWSATSWSAQNVLGPPDVFPAHGDNARAWASRDADAPTEFIEVGFARPQRLHQLQIVETFNPGAISTVDLVTITGRHIQVHASPNTYISGSTSALNTIQFACTDEPIVAARVTVASGAVTGWNEIDAIGAIACTDTH